MTTREMILRAVRFAVDANPAAMPCDLPELVVAAFDGIAKAEADRILSRLSGRVLDAVAETIESVDKLEDALSKFADADDVGRELAAKDARDAAIGVKVDAEFLAATLQRGRRW